MDYAHRGYVSSVRAADCRGFLNERLRVISVLRSNPANTRACVGPLSAVCDQWASLAAKQSTSSEHVDVTVCEVEKISAVSCFSITPRKRNQVVSGTLRTNRGD